MLPDWDLVPWASLVLIALRKHAIALEFEGHSFGENQLKQFGSELKGCIRCLTGSHEIHVDFAHNEIEFDSRLITVAYGLATG